VNSSKHGIYDVISYENDYGARVLDNCWNLQLRAVIQNAVHSGFIYGNQAVNHSDNNEFHLTVNGGCSDYGIQIGANCTSSRITASLHGISGAGVYELAAPYIALSANYPHSNVYHITTTGCGKGSCRIDGSHGIWEINSYKDGVAGAQGASYAIDVYGDYNIINAVVVDGTPWQVRGLFFRPGSTGNILAAYRASTVVTNYYDWGDDNVPYPASDTFVSFNDESVMLDDAIVTFSGTYTS
jgi:hypothetical protein